MLILRGNTHGWKESQSRNPISSRLSLRFQHLSTPPLLLPLLILPLSDGLNARMDLLWHRSSSGLGGGRTLASGRPFAESVDPDIDKCLPVGAVVDFVGSSEDGVRFGGARALVQTQRFSAGGHDDKVRVGGLDVWVRDHLERSIDEYGYFWKENVLLFGETCTRTT